MALPYVPSPSRMLAHVRDMPVQMIGVCLRHLGSPLPLMPWMPQWTTRWRASQAPVQMVVMHVLGMAAVVPLPRCLVDEHARPLTRVQQSGVSV